MEVTRTEERTVSKFIIANIVHDWY